MIRPLLLCALAVTFASMTVMNVTAQSEGESNQPVAQDTQSDQRSLKQVIGSRFKIGVGVGHAVVQQPEDAALIRQHFQILTAENCMKPQGIHPAEDEWNF